MSLFANGVLYVDYFTPTETPGEYTFENGVFNNQNDTSGLGAYLVDTTFVMFIPLLDPNTAMPLASVQGRYKLTSVTTPDGVLLSGTILYDEDGVESGAPMGGAYSLISSTSANHKLAAPPLDSLYTDLPLGSTTAAIINDLINRVDKITGSGTSTPVPPVTLYITSIGQTVFEITGPVPVNPESSLLQINGVLYLYGVGNDYTISGSTLTWTGAFELDPTDSMVLRA